MSVRGSQPQRSRRRTGWRGLIYRSWPLQIGLGIALLTVRLWLPLLGWWLVVADPLAPADALVPLAGEPLRVDYTAELYHRDLAPRLVLTDMWVGNSDPRIRHIDAVRQQALADGVPPEHIVEAPGVPDSTYAEAVILRRLAEERGWRSLIVVTSPQHTRRAKLILGAVFAGSGVAIQVRPVEAYWYTWQTWWSSPEGRRETALEYLKLGAYLLGYQ